MARKQKSEVQQAISQARAHSKSIQRQSKELLRRAQLDVREYRKEISLLKKQGIISKKIDARTHTPTRYMLSKLKKFKDVATGHALAVPVSKLPKGRADEYVSRGTMRQVGGFVVVPKTAVRQRADVVKGHIATYTLLGSGEERVIFLPYGGNRLSDIVAQLKDHESEINQLKGSKEQFGFQLFGHNSKRGFPDAETFRSYLEDQYSHILAKPKDNREAFQHFVIIRFRNKKGMPQGEPYEGKKYYKRKGENRRDDTYYQQYKKDLAAKRKRAERERETPEQRKARLEQQRRYDRENANKRREARMGKRLLDW
jgi:hypothetical protein